MPSEQESKNRSGFGQERVAVYDRPIKKPADGIPEEFIRTIESRFVTRRFPKPDVTKLTGPRKTPRPRTNLS